jgi:hypothetical protein
MKHTKEVEATKRDLHALFTKIATIIEEHDDGCYSDDYIDMYVKPLVEAFIERHHSDIEPGHFTLFLWMWFEQWRKSTGLWLPAFSSVVGD